MEREQLKQRLLGSSRSAHLRPHHICDDRSRFLLLLTWVPHSLGLCELTFSYLVGLYQTVCFFFFYPHTHTHSYRKKKKKRERETRCLSRIDSRHLIFSFLFFLYFSVCLFLLLGLLVAAFPSFRSIPSLYFFKIPPTPYKHTDTLVGCDQQDEIHTHTHKPSVVVSIPQFPLFMGSAPSRPVVQEMPSNLIGLGEEFAHIQRRQMDEEKKN